MSAFWFFLTGVAGIISCMMIRSWLDEREHNRFMREWNEEIATLEKR